MEPARSSPPKAPFEVMTPQGFRPYIPPAAEPAFTEERARPENPQNPRGGPSPNLPQQATPIASRQGVLSSDDLALPDHELNNLVQQQDGLAPDNPYNPKGTPDYIVEAVTDPDAPPTLHSIEPTSTPVSNEPIELNVAGAGFKEDDLIRVDGQTLETNFINQNRLSAEYTPDTAGTKQVVVGDLPPQTLEVTEEGTDAE